MTAAFFGLAGLSALNPKLLVIDLILAGNKRPRLMFVCFLLAGIGLALTVGLLDVLVLHVDVLKTQNHVGGGLDLALGIPLLAIGALLATGHLHRRRRLAKPPSKLEVWLQRKMHEPNYALAVLIGAIVGIPGVSYFLALHHLTSSNLPTAKQVIAVFVFVLINSHPVIVPFAFGLVHPRRTDNAIKRLKDWLTNHERQITAAVALLVGAFMVISGTLRVLN